ncbi:MAG: amidase [Hyphomonas sp.]|nr:amidase [Hyphomonas sp.]
MKPSDYLTCDATDLAALVKAKEVSAEEVLDAAWDVIEAVNPAVNAVTRDARDIARADIAAGLPDGPFTGVPFVLKDEYLFRDGLPCDFASRMGEGTTSPTTSTLLQRYMDAGLVITGKTNLPEFGASVTTEPVAKGRTNNPWNPEHTAGGSSGGSAAAVAAGMVPMAYGNDGAGSIRIPGSCCGVFGLKPTRGRTPTGPEDGEYWNGLVIQHALTRTVRDSAALLDATEGWEAGSLYPAPPKPRAYLDELGQDTGKLRIGMATTSPIGSVVDPACVVAVEAAAKLLQDMGHTVEEATPDHDAKALGAGILDLMNIHVAFGIDGLAAMHGRTPSLETVERAHLETARRGREMSAQRMLEILELMGSTARRAAPFFEAYDLWLTPTLATPPVKHGQITTNDSDADRYLNGFLEFVPFTPLANVTGCPAMTLPLHWTEEGLPVGVHFMSAFGDEGLLFRLAARLEEALRWADKHPRLSGWEMM